MEASRNDIKVIPADDDDDRLYFQIVHLLQVGCETALNYSVMTVQFMLYPLILIYSFWIHALEHSWEIVKIVINEILDMMLVVPLAFELFAWSSILFFEFVLLFKNAEEIADDVKEKVYMKLKILIRKLKFFCSPRSAAALYSITKKVISEDHPLFPKVLFEDAFTKVKFQKGTISMVVTTPLKSSQSGTEPQTSTEAPTLTQTTTSESIPTINEPKPAGTKKKIVRTDDKPKIIDIPANQDSRDSDN